MSKPVKIAWALILGLCLTLIFIMPLNASLQASNEPRGKSWRVGSLGVEELG